MRISSEICCGDKISLLYGILVPRPLCVEGFVLKLIQCIAMIRCFQCKVDVADEMIGPLIKNNGWLS